MLSLQFAIPASATTEWYIQALLFVYSIFEIMNPSTEASNTEPVRSTCVIDTREGPVRGYVDKEDAKSYYKFKSIPYAKPPIGHLRFMPPQPALPWTEEIDCTEESPKPVSYGRGLKIVGTEDCLYLEVITPNIKPDKPMPVMFWIPSYGFVFLIEEVYDPSLITDQEVVFVHCNARVGPFGFLSINDISAPGNIGLKDLVMGLKWVQRNISAFGGDPNNVTIFGTSSGGSMVHFMMLSPMATGLFHKAIIQSATAFNNWSIDKNPTAVVMELAKNMGIPSTYMVKIVEEMKTCSKDDIMSAYRAMIKESIIKYERNYVDCIFKPCIEEEFEGQPAFLTRSPALIIKSGNFNKVPFIIGSNDRESDFLQFLHKKEFSPEKSDMVPKPLALEDNLEQVVSQKILKFYAGEDSFTENSKEQYHQVVTDFFFLYHVTKTIKLHKTSEPGCQIYYYIFTHVGEWILPEDLTFFNRPGHHSEIPFLFRLNAPDSPPCKGSRDSIVTRKRVVRMWTNFAKYGDPTPDENDPILQIKWEPVENANKLNYLNIGCELTKGRNPFSDRMAFWDDLLNQHQFLKILSFFHDHGFAC